MSNIHFSSKTDNWSTPQDLFDKPKVKQLEWNHVVTLKVRSKCGRYEISLDGQCWAYINNIKTRITRNMLSSYIEDSMEFVQSYHNAWVLSMLDSE